MRPRQTILSFALAVGVALTGIGANDIAGRYNMLSHQMMCTCGCAQLLGECNHVGCPNSPGMLASLHTDLSGGMSDHAVLVDFEQKYGPTALASPLLTRFNQAAWVVPPAVLIFGMLAALLLLRRWKETHQAVPAAARKPLTSREADTLARIRRETGEL